MAIQTMASEHDVRVFMLRRFCFISQDVRLVKAGLCITAAQLLLRLHHRIAKGRPLVPL